MGEIPTSLGRRRGDRRVPGGDGGSSPPVTAAAARRRRRRWRFAAEREAAERERGRERERRQRERERGRDRERGERGDVTGGRRRSPATPKSPAEIGERVGCWRRGEIFFFEMEEGREANSFSEIRATHYWASPLGQVINLVRWSLIISFWAENLKEMRSLGFEA